MAIKNKNKVIKEPGAVSVSEPVFTHEQLLDALFFFWDGFERSTMNFFLVKDTAHQVINNENLKGDKLTLGIRRVEWHGGQQRIFRAFMEHEKMLPESMKNGLIFKYKNIPIELYVYDENPCLNALDIVFYHNDTFNTPNPFSIFERIYDFK
jgi:hypothetical protein